VEKPLRYGLFNRLGKVVVRRADVNRVLNRREAAKYTGMGIPAERVKIIPTPVGIDSFTPGPADPAIRARWGIPPDAPLLLWVGRPGYVKRVETLITSLNNLQGEFPTVHLLLVGDFDAYQKIPALVGELKLGDRVCFAGKVAHEDLPGLYRACDLYVHSSLYEGLGMVLIEAGACGKPVVSARTAGAESILVDGETGLLCTIDDPADMADQIAGLLRDPERARRMGEAARKHIVKTFDPQKNLEAVIASWLYTAQIGKRP
jgi:phosphatidylinositol alpha-1,6-mannosyltransferase